MTQRTPAPGAAAGGAVAVTAPARLHMGFIDPAGTAGRRFGGIGMAIESPATRVVVAAADRPSVQGAEVERAGRWARELLAHLAWDRPVAIDVQDAMPAHAGLGSGTQLALALGRGLSLHAGRPMASTAVASLLDRGGRSGIGIGAFDHGGFIVDGGKAPLADGRSTSPAPPPIIARHPVPARWRVLLVFDRGFRGLSGEREREAFRDLARRSPRDVEAHAMLVLMGMLPALVEEDLAAFGRAVTELQARVGDHFAPAQGGRFASPAVTEVLAWLQRRGVHGVGQSSWGPTGFGLCEDEAQALALLRELEAHRRAHSRLVFTVAVPRNAPARTRHLPPGPQTERSNWPANTFDSKD